MCNLYSFVPLPLTLEDILCNITFHNCPSYIFVYSVDIVTALEAELIDDEACGVLFNLNSNDELIPSSLGTNLKSQWVCLSLPPLNPDTDAVVVGMVVVITSLPSIPAVNWVRIIEPLEFAKNVSPSIVIKSCPVFVKNCTESDTSIFPKWPFICDMEVDISVAISSLSVRPFVWIRTLPELSIVPVAPSASSSNI